MIQITIQSEPIQATLNELANRTQHLSPAFDAIGQVIRTNVIDCFEHEQSPDGINWKALEPATLAKRRKGGAQQYPDAILRDTGAMFNSLGHNATDNYVDITIGQDYAQFHQFGTSKMAARPFFPSDILPVSWEQEIVEIARRYLTML